MKSGGILSSLNSGTSGSLGARFAGPIGSSLNSEIVSESVYFIDYIHTCVYVCL